MWENYFFLVISEKGPFQKSERASRSVNGLNRRFKMLDV